MNSALLSDAVNPNSWRATTNTATISAWLSGDLEAVAASSVCDISTPRTAQSPVATFLGIHYRHSIRRNKYTGDGFGDTVDHAVRLTLEHIFLLFSMMCL